MEDGNKGKNNNDERQETDSIQEEHDSSAKNVPENKMDTEDNVGATEEATKKDDEQKGNKKQRVQKVAQEPAVAGPSGLIPLQDVIVELNEYMVMCKYKLPFNESTETKKPYEVHFGENLATALPSQARNGKRKLKSADKQKKERRRLRFSQTSVYYFQKTKTQTEVGMEPVHFLSSLLPVEVFEAQKEMHQRRRKAAERNREGDGGSSSSASSTDSEEDDETSTDSSSDEEGCRCTLYCDGYVCTCSLKGRKCRVFRKGYPCSCKMKYCKNPHGRIAYNFEERTNTDDSPPDSPSKRVFKRKQLGPHSKKQ